jgi:pimeloyl-ACP methyl ester carboxylesterase
MEVSVDGQRVWAATGGQPFVASKPCIVFLHGAGCDHTTWTLPGRWFAHHGWSVLAPDLPGHGRSGGAPLKTVEAMSHWVDRLVDGLGVGGYALVGHSMGGAIAVEAAARRPDRVSHLALIGTAAAVPVGKALLDTAGSDPAAAFEMMTAWGHGPSARLGGSPTPGLWMSGTTRRTFDQNRPEILAIDLAACAAWETGRAAAAQVGCPTAVIVAAHDLMTPARRGRELAALIGSATVTEIEQAGHMLLSEAPDACLDALIALTRRQARS